MKELLKLFWVFFKIGLFTFGGGYAMLPMMERELIHNCGWVTQDELLNYYAIAQCTPGVIAVNTATFVGTKKKGLLGSVFATLGVVTPSIIIILAIASLLKNFADNTYVQKAFIGIRAAVAALITSSVIKLAKNGIKNLFQILTAAAAFIIVAVLGQSPVYVVIAAVAAGLIYGWAVKMK
ncbi:MAG: chromate transporter [Christensenellaceae bacterium]|nr:chromate transporter [Christensenellaceae bacterium]